MPKDLIGQLRGWQEAAKGADEYWNPEEAVDPAVVAAKEKAIKDARNRRAEAKWSRTEQRKRDFLIREREKAQMVADRKAQKAWDQLPQDEQQRQLISGLQSIGSTWARALGFMQ